MNIIAINLPTGEEFIVPLERVKAVLLVTMVK